MPLNRERENAGSYPFWENRKRSPFTTPAALVTPKHFSEGLRTGVVMGAVDQRSQRGFG